MASYDIYFAGELKAGTDPAVVRARIRALFKLSGEAAAQLFSGRTVALKRGLDLAQAERLRQVFLEAGALARLVEQRSDKAATSVMSTGQPARAGGDEAVKRPWVLATKDGRPLEPDPGYAPPMVDISRMRLIVGQDWNLADCDRPPVPVAVPDTSHLRILAPEPGVGAGDGRGEP